jgi:hypothetical protein
VEELQAEGAASSGEGDVGSGVKGWWRAGNAAAATDGGKAAMAVARPWPGSADSDGAAGHGASKTSAGRGPPSSSLPRLPSLPGTTWMKPTTMHGSGGRGRLAASSRGGGGVRDGGACALWSLARLLVAWSREELFPWWREVVRGGGGAGGGE